MAAELSVVRDVHGRTLLGALDTYEGTLHHNRPYVAIAHMAVLEAIAARWLEGHGPNWLPALPRDWAEAVIESDDSTDPDAARGILAEFFEWALHADLITRESAESTTGALR